MSRRVSVVTGSSIGAVSVAVTRAQRARRRGGERRGPGLYVALADRGGVAVEGPEDRLRTSLADPVEFHQSLAGVLGVHLAEVVGVLDQGPRGLARPSRPRCGGRAWSCRARRPSGALCVEVDRADVVDDLAARLAVQLSHALVANVDVVPASAGDDDGEVVEREVIFEEVEESQERLLALGEHLGVGGCVRVDARRWSASRSKTRSAERHPFCDIVDAPGSS